MPGVTQVGVFETAYATLRLQVVRSNPAFPGELTTTQFSQASYLTNFDPSKPNLEAALLPLRKEDKETLKDAAKYAIHKAQNQWILPTHPIYGQGILLPKSFRDTTPSVVVGDRGT
ncbi:MAG TPA: hypothetical protein VN457_02090, partial [Chlamydiales bacterium]|nr:hypothetical protein [Chlamydiales bacterium]